MSDCGCDDSGGGDYGGGDSGGCDYGGGDSGGYDYGGGDSGGGDYGGGDDDRNYGGGEDDDRNYEVGNEETCCVVEVDEAPNCDNYESPAVAVFSEDTYETRVADTTYIPMHTYTKYSSSRPYNTTIHTRSYSTPVHTRNTYYTSSSSEGCGDDHTNNIIVGIVSGFLILLMLLALVNYNSHPHR